MFSAQGGSCSCQGASGGIEKSCRFPESDNEKLTEQWRKDKASYDKDLAAITKELEQVKSRHSSQVCTSSAYVGFVWLLLASAYLSSHKIFTVATVT